MRWAILILAFLPAAVAAQAATPEGADRPAQPRLICRYEEVSGSRLRQRNCFSADTWAAKDRQRADMASLLNGHAIDHPSGNAFSK